MQDKAILLRTKENLPELFAGFTDNCVLVHGNFTLRSMLKDSRTDQLLAVLNPGIMLWAPREFELFRLNESGLSESLFWHYSKGLRWTRPSCGVAGCMCCGMKSASYSALAV